MTTVVENVKPTETTKPAANGRKEETPKPAAPPPPAQTTAPEAIDADDEIPDRFEVLAKIIRILKPLPSSERHAVVASLAEMVQ